MKNDAQQNTVYAWEDANVKPFDTSRVHVSHAQAVVDYIWNNEGLLHPPKVQQLSKQTKKIAGCATRADIKLQEYVPTWIIIHEIAHSMTSDILDDRSHGHNKHYVGLYMKLLAKYLPNIKIENLTSTADAWGVEYNLAANPLM